MRFDSLIFDIDGTLWDATSAVAASFSEASAELPFGKKLFTREQIKKELGLPLNVIFMHLYPELQSLMHTDPQHAEELLARLNRISTEAEYAYLEAHGADMYPGVPETLKFLADRLPLFIVSNCEKGYIELMTRVCGIDRYFTDHLSYGDTESEKDINIRMLAERYKLKAPAYIGDIEKDALSSRRAGVQFIWAAYGFGSVGQELYCEKIDDFRELKNIIK